jgi:hypothetical protein
VAIDAALPAPLGNVMFVWLEFTLAPLASV